VQRALVIRARQGDDEAFGALARVVGDRCMAIAFRILRDVDLADEAVQTALVAAWRDLRSLRDPDRFEPWLHRILVRECYEVARQQRRWSADVRLLPPPVAPDDDAILTVEDRDLLERAFRRLTIEQRTVLVFHHYVGLPLTEVAERVGVPLGTVKSRLHHATAAMRASVEADARTSSTPQERPA
jgi:RNA polymerase sigma-70 factor (ECF subfamily)